MTCNLKGVWALKIVISDQYIRLYVGCADFIVVLVATIFRAIGEIVSYKCAARGHSYA